MSIESMEFKLPFPTLQHLAVLEIAHSLMDLNANDYSLIETRINFLRESLSKVDKLEILDEQKCRIREVLKGTSDHLQNWFTCNMRARGRPKLRFDVHGCVDEEGMARDFLHKFHSDERYDTDLKTLKLLLHVASYYVLLPDIQEILQKILKLLAADSIIPLLDGPEYQIDTDEKLCLVYKFVDQQGIPMSLNFDYFGDLPDHSAIRGSNSCVRITLHRYLYNSELFQLQWNLLEPSKRIPFVRNLIITMSSCHLVHQVVDILHFLDSNSRRCILGEIPDEWDNYEFLCCLLVWPYQEFFLPALQLVGALQHYKLINLFEYILFKVDMVAFEEILRLFWEAISAEFKSRFSHSSLFKSRYSLFSLDESFKDLLKELSQKNVPMYKRVSADLNQPLTYLPESCKRKHDESSSSKSDV